MLGHASIKQEWANGICSIVDERTVQPIFIWGGADTSLARPNSRCRRTESTVSLERGVCSCAELQVYFCYRGGKEACQSTRAISATSRRDLSSSFFSPSEVTVAGAHPYVAPHSYTFRCSNCKRNTRRYEKRIWKYCCRFRLWTHKINRAQLSQIQHVSLKCVIMK